MKYGHIEKGTFLERPNRFIAYVEVQGERHVVHVKNTGRCKELLIPGAEVYLEKSENPERKTAYDLVAVKKGERIINMDSQAPNKIVEEWLKKKILFPGLVSLRPETTYGKSRFDFYAETEKDKIFIEVKGVTLEKDGVVSFPDAPSDRAVKHVEELVEARKAGYKTYIIFVVQMKGVQYFTPNWDTHPEFARALLKASKEGVRILALDCEVTPKEAVLRDEVPVRLERYVEGISLPLLKWYDTHKRDLPWRAEPTPYHVWLSEIMLQQTRVEAVKPYYKRFLEHLPDIESLAKAEEEVLLKLWEGLGYYSRVRNLKKAAIQVMEEYNGVMPDSYEELLKLKGIGSYTGGAIASIAFARPVPAVDGNVLRVLSRIHMDDSDIADTKVKQRVEQELLEVIPSDRPGDFNQAMMELGATVCVPNGAPHCEECPLASVCKAYINNCMEEYPKKAAKKARSIEKKTILILQDSEKVALHKREEKGLLAGMYEFPWMEGHAGSKSVERYLKENGIMPLRIQKIKEAKHIFSHKEWHMIGYAIRVDELEPKGLGEESKDWVYIEPAETKEKYPIPSAFSAFVPYLNIRQGKDKFKELPD